MYKRRRRWEARGWGQAATEPPMADAMQEHRMLAPDQGSRLDVAYRLNSDMQAWLDTYFELIRDAGLRR